MYFISIKKIGFNVRANESYAKDPRSTKEAQELITQILESYTLFGLVEMKSGWMKNTKRKSRERRWVFHCLVHKG